MKQKKEIVEKVLKSQNFESLNPIQQEMLSKGLTTADIVLLAPTGSGKTIAFLLPLLHHLNTNIPGVQSLILVPSRELAIQIEQVFRSISSGFKVNSCYGGHSMKIERQNFTEPPAVLVGTPGRIADHLRRGHFDPQSIHTLVLDEFDKSLEMGFSNEMSDIISQLPAIKKRILTSATQAVDIPPFSGVTNPETLNFLSGEERPSLVFKAVRAKGNDKLELLIQLICTLGNEATLVFCNHREAVDRISSLLLQEGVAHDTFHGGLDQDERERALLKFRNGSHNILITTDLASRGLDIPEIKNIIHYQGATTQEVFIHRNGRTARMKSSGTVWLVLAEEETISGFPDSKPEIVTLQEQIPLPSPPQWITLYFGAGKKDKIGRADIVGFLIQKGGLQKEEIGLITLLDSSSFVAILRAKADQVINRIKSEKIKNKKVKIAISE